MEQGMGIKDINNYEINKGNMNQEHIMRGKGWHNIMIPFGQVHRLET
jgi:hypothetical protein